MSKLRGLPQEKTMRHDSHFVDEITSTRTDAVGRLIDIQRIEPNPHQPRKDFGDLTDMVASIKEKGILEPILVRGQGGRFQIIAGERRYQAAKLAGLRNLPCIEVDVDNRGMLEISLIENLQRKDLHPFEESEAILSLSDQFRYTHEEIARKLGKSRPVITEALSLCRIPQEVRDRCRQADITSKSMLLQVARQDGTEAMLQLVEKIAGEGLTREEARRVGSRASGQGRRAKRFVYRFKPEDEAFHFMVSFARPKVDRTELIEALRGVLARLLAEDGGERPVGTAAPKGSAQVPAGTS